MKRSVMFDALRVVPILYVIAIVHARQYSDVLRNAIDSHFPAWGYIVGAMATMFFISGYLLSRRSTIQNWSDVKSFYLKRFVRILPLFAVSLLTFPSASSWYVKALSLLGANNFIPGIGANGSAKNLLTLWFVSVLIVFYAVFPLISWLRRRNGILFCIGFEVFLALGVYFLKWEPRMVYYFPFFATGVLLSGINERHVFYGATAFGLGYGVIRSLGMFNDVEVILRPLRTFVVIAFSCLLSYAKVLSKPFSILANSSFYAYLFHRQIFGILRSMHIPDGWMRIALIYLVFVPMSFVVGWLVQYEYDQAVRRMTEKRV